MASQDEHHHQCHSIEEETQDGSTNSQTIEQKRMIRHREILVSGYIREQEDKQSLSAVFPSEITKVLTEYYALWNFYFGYHDDTKFEVSGGGTVLKSIDAKSCSGYMVYADGASGEEGISSGIHMWSLQSLSDRSGNCYQSIGVTQIKPSDPKVKERSSHWNSHGGGSHFQGYTNWTKNDVITIRLDCEQWKVTYFRGTKEYQTDKIKEGIYYLVLSLCCAKGMVHLQAVDCPIVDKIL